MRYSEPSTSRGRPSSDATGQHRAPPPTAHITRGPEDPTRVALEFAIAKAALDDGNLRELYDAFVAGGGRFFVSAGSSKARGVTEQDITGRSADFAGPPKLLQLSLDHDRMFVY